MPKTKQVKKARGRPAKREKKTFVQKKPDQIIKDQAYFERLEKEAQPEANSPEKVEA